MTDEKLETVHGGCHCGAVAYKARLPRKLTAHRCNCSICSMTGFVHVIVPANRFNLDRGRDMLETYRFNTGVAAHFFCRRCGVKSFYVPRSNPDGFSLNLACLDLADGICVTVEPFDGRHWEREAGRLRQLSTPDVAD